MKKAFIEKKVNYETHPKAMCILTLMEILVQKTTKYMVFSIKKVVGLKRRISIDRLNKLKLWLSQLIEAMRAYIQFINISCIIY